MMATVGVWTGPLNALYIIGTVGIFGVGLVCCWLGFRVRRLRHAMEALLAVGAWQMTFVVTRSLVQTNVLGRETAMLIGGLGAWACFSIVAQLAVTDWVLSRARKGTHYGTSRTENQV